MGLLDRLRGRGVARPEGRAARRAADADLREFIATRTDVEAWVEKPTSLNQASILLVAWDGEWLRRSVPSVEWACDFCRDRRIAFHEAGVVGYPQRMRDYNARQKGRG